MTPNKKIYNHSFLHGLGGLKIDNFVIYKSPPNLTVEPICVTYVPRIKEPTEFRPRRSIKSRYSQKVVNNNYYSTATFETP